VAITLGTIHRHLIRLPQRSSLDAVLGDESAYELPLPVRNWPAGVRYLPRCNAEFPIQVQPLCPLYLCQPRFDPVRFRQHENGCHSVKKRRLAHANKPKVHPA
jgi:hypothetical protein